MYVVVDFVAVTTGCCFANKSLINAAKEMLSETYPADCRKIAAVDSNKHDWD